MADNGKITFELELDDSKVKGQVDRTIQQLKQISANQDVKINVTADTSGATGQLKSLKSVATDLENTDPDVTVTADTSGAVGQLENVKSAADEATKSFDGLSTAMQHAVGNWISAAGSGLFNGAKNAIGGAFNSGVAYEKGLAKVNTLAGLEKPDLDALSDDLLWISNLYGQDATIITEAAYNLLSAGAGVSDLPDLLNLSGMLAMGGFTDINTAGAAMMKTANAYGLTANGENLAEIARLMMMTQNLGITDVGKLSGTLAQVTPVAGANNVSFEQVSAAMAVLTKSGVETSTAAVQMKDLIGELGKDGSTANLAMQKAFGEGSTLKGLMDKGEDLYSILLKMQQTGEKNGDGFSTLFSSSEAYSAALMLLGMNENGSVWQQTRAAISGSEGVVEDAYATMRDTTATTLAQINTELTNTGIKLFEAFSPAFDKFLTLLTGEQVDEMLTKITDAVNAFASGDGFSSLIEKLGDAAVFLLNVLNGDITIDDMLNSAGEAFANGMAAVMDGIFADLVNSVIDSINEAFGWMGIKLDHIQTGGSKEENDAGRSASTEEMEASAKAAAESMDTVAAKTGEASGKAEQSATGMATLYGHIASAVSTAGSLPGALSSLVSQIRAVRIANNGTTGGGGGTGQTMNFHAVGLDYVPFDNYPAMLHKGEMVLNAAEASAFRLYGAGAGGGDSIDYNALASAMANVHIDMDGRAVGRLVEPHVSRSQGERYSRMKEV